MKTIYSSVLFFFLTFCCVGQKKEGQNMQGNHEYSKAASFIKTESDVIIKFDDKLFVKLVAKAYSMDSVIVYTTFFNYSDKYFYLYKPLLPAHNLLKESVFNFIIEDNKMDFEIRFNDSSEGRYYAGNRSVLPCVIPDLKADNFLIIKANDSISFAINVSSFYPINSAIKKGAKKISISYAAVFPFVNNKYEQVFEVEKGKTKRNEKKPVFYHIGMQKSDKGDKYLYKRAYITIE
jgi:hypothetical protein